MDIYDTINPLDFRYYTKSKNYTELNQYFSENARIYYLLKVEEALVKTLVKYRIAPKKAFIEISSAINKVTTKDVYEEEFRIKHDIRALVNSIKKHVSSETKPYIHFTATSYDIISTAESLRLKEGVLNAIVPILKEFEKTLIHIAMREKDTVQIGRTHGQHAEPITFGFALSEYVSRLGRKIMQIEDAANNLCGKISGATGSYNASSLFFNDPEKFERDILQNLGLNASTHSTQIVEPEYVTDLVHHAISAFGILANLADDMRALQRSEIAEIGEAFMSDQVGSSTMPHKRNPINFENVKSFFLEYSTRMTTRYMNLISEHQRDLTNSASSRFIPEIFVGLALSTERLSIVMKKMAVDKKNMEKNFLISKEFVAAEPAYLLLASYGHPDAHEYVKQLTLKAQRENKSFVDLFLNDIKIKDYIDQFSKKQLDLVKDSENYTGISSKKTESVCQYWQKRLNIRKS